MIIIIYLDAVTIVLFKVLGAFANRPFDNTLTPEEQGVISASQVRIIIFLNFTKLLLH